MVKKPSVKESAVERELMRRVQGRDGICVKAQALGVRGFFDRIIILPGPRIIFAEVKKPRGSRISPHQHQYHEMFRALDVEVAIVRNSADIDALLK
jgi:hypothetical protein